VHEAWSHVGLNVGPDKSLPKIQIKNNDLDKLVAVVSDKCEPVSVYRQRPEPMLNKVGATRRESRFGWS